MFVQKDFDLIGLRGQKTRQCCGAFHRRAMDWNGLIQGSQREVYTFKGPFNGGELDPRLPADDPYRDVDPGALDSRAQKDRNTLGECIAAAKENPQRRSSQHWQ